MGGPGWMTNVNIEGFSTYIFKGIYASSLHCEYANRDLSGKDVSMPGFSVGNGQCRTVSRMKVLTVDASIESISRFITNVK